MTNNEWTEILKEMGYGGPKDVERKVGTLRRVREDLGEKIGILGSFEFSKGFPKDTAEDIREVVKHLEQAFEILLNYGGVETMIDSNSPLNG